jgi:hypothetical protein
MALAAPRIDDLFGGVAVDQRVERFEQFKSVLAACQQKSYAAASRGEVVFAKGEGIVKTGVADTSNTIESLRSEMTTKAMAPEQIAQVSQALETLAELNKDWTLSNPLGAPTSTGSTGLVPYDLDPALALLVPRSFILRNSISRIGGQGTAKEFRRITGVSNSNTGGVANLSTFFSSASAGVQFGGTNGSAPTLQRPSKISYAADRKVFSYVEQGVSDEVNMNAQFQAQGYTDLRQLSHTSLIWAHMLGEERNLLNGRGNTSGGNVGYAKDTSTGALAVPVVGNFTKAAATTSGGTLVGGTDTLYYKITYSSSAGETAATAEGSQAVTGSNNSVTITAPTSLPAAVIAWNVYSGTSTGVYTSKTTVVGNTTTILSAGSGSFTAPSSAADSSAVGYDGLIAAYTDTSAAGYVKRLNGTLSTTEPGAEFQDAFASLYASVIGDADTILTSGSVRRALAKAIQQSGGTATGYRINYDGGDGVNIGSVVTGLANETTGKMVDLVAHPYMPAGVALVWQKTLPFPDSGVAETTQVANVQDMMVIEWPTIQMSYDVSSYQIGTLLHRAPAWSGAITGITG